MRLTKAQTEARKRLEELAGQPLTPEVAGAGIMSALSLALPNDGFRLFGVDPRTLLVNRLLAASENDDWARSEWLRDVYLAADPLTYIELPNLMSMGVPVAANQERQEACWGIPPDVLRQISEQDHARAFHEIGSPLGGTVLASFGARGQWVGAMQLYRRDPGSTFRPVDIEFVRLIGPAVGRLIDDTLTRERIDSIQTSGDADLVPSGVILLEPDGSLRHVTPAGEEWLAKLRSSDAGASAREMPTAIDAVIAGLRRDPTVSRITTRTYGSALTIEATRGGADGSVAVVITPEPQQRSPLIPVHWPLTAQERAVVERLLTGESNLQIAAALFISENTVQTHLRHIYGKLEINSRTQLLARYFRETFTYS